MAPRSPDRPPGTANPFRFAQAVATFAFLALAAYTLFGFLRAIAWAAVLAIALWPLFDRFAGSLAHGSWRKLWAPLVFTALVVTIFLIPVVMAGLEFREDASSVMTTVVAAKAQGYPAPSWVVRIPLLGGRAAQFWNEQIGTADAVAGLSHRLQGMHLSDATRSIGAAIVSRSVTLVFTVLTLFFLLRDGDTITDITNRTAQRLLGPGGTSLSQQIVAAVRGAVLGLVVVGLGEGVVIGLAFEFLAVPHPILFAAGVALLSPIPMGAMLIVIIAAIFLFIASHTLHAIILIAIGAVVTFVADHFIRPVLIGGAAQLPFILVLLALLGGLESFGLIGLFVGPAAVSACALLWRAWLDGKAEIA
ncbi:MAG TPA: AI-2E family transporter [Stellaceae bacterium]|nr:AI-2E family transporter [Stellaceae bacterium]